MPGPAAIGSRQTLTQGALSEHSTAARTHMDQILEGVRNTAESEGTRPVSRRGSAAPGFRTGRSVMEGWRNLPRDAAGKISRSAFARQFNLTGAALSYAMSVRRREEGEANAEAPESLTLRHVAKAYFKSNPGPIDMKAFAEHAKKLGVQRLTGIDNVVAKYARKFGVPAPHYASCAGAASAPSGIARAHARDVARAFTCATDTPVVTTPEELLAALGPRERTLLDDALRQFAEHGEPPEKRCRNDETAPADGSDSEPANAAQPTRLPISVVAQLWRLVPDVQKVMIGPTTFCRLFGSRRDSLKNYTNYWGQWTRYAGHGDGSLAEQEIPGQAPGKSLRQVLAAYRLSHRGPLVLEHLVQHLRTEGVQTLAGLPKWLEGQGRLTGIILPVQRGTPPELRSAAPFSRLPPAQQAKVDEAFEAAARRLSWPLK